MAKYIWNEQTQKLELVNEFGFRDPNKGLNGPIWCPEGGYFDKALNKWFNDKTEKRTYMREKGLKMDGSSTRNDADFANLGGVRRRNYFFMNK